MSAEEGFGEISEFFCIVSLHAGEISTLKDHDKVVFTTNFHFLVVVSSHGLSLSEVSFLNCRSCFFHYMLLLTIYFS